MRLNLMDYSLLLAIHDMNRAEEEGIPQDSEDDVIEVRINCRNVFIIAFKICSVLSYTINETFLCVCVCVKMSNDALF